MKSKKIKEMLKRLDIKKVNDKYIVNFKDGDSFSYDGIFYDKGLITFYLKDKAVAIYDGSWIIYVSDESKLKISIW
ncbi:MAG: hypothetical protein QW478_14215 [Candidatus Micrarchaeaceae archaeon]